MAELDLDAIKRDLGRLAEVRALVAEVHRLQRLVEMGRSTLRLAGELERENNTLKARLFSLERETASLRAALDAALAYAYAPTEEIRAQCHPVMQEALAALEVQDE